jgi:beta-galactosidase GanA
MASRQVARGKKFSAKGQRLTRSSWPWYFARYVDRVTEVGKKEYSLPMFVNAALIRPGHMPGQYPSAGPLPHLIDIWRAGAPKIDFFSPDIYFKNFAEWVEEVRSVRKCCVYT